MRASQFLISTAKETPADAEILSHQLMLRAGMIRRLASGLYTWLPVGLRVLRKVEAIVREEMDRSGAQEVLMPVVQPAELWEESSRWNEFGPELLRMEDRHGRPFCLGPTHEEVITELARAELHSYKQLPVNFYQIQTKFRDEIRPRFGVMRSREFLMKDAYSFHVDDDSLDSTYQLMYRTYSQIFDRIGLEYRAVIADTGSIGGSGSHEFHVLADSGEDAIVFSDSGQYAANIEKAEALAAPPPSPVADGPFEQIETPGQHTIEEVATFTGTTAAQNLKTLVVAGNSDDSEDDSAPRLVALILRGDHQLSQIKAENHPLVAAPLRFASEEEIVSATGCRPGSLGPVNLPMPLLVDRSAAALESFICGANKDGLHLRGVRWERDCEASEICDLRNVIDGDPSPDGDGLLTIRRGIEVGHIFKLGRKYSESMNAQVLDANGRNQPMAMGCYGIGVSRIVAAAIEQNHDEHGIIWPLSIAPFSVAIIGLNIHKSDAVREAADALYEQLVLAGADVLLDDRKERPGVKFADMELLGIPHQVVIGDRSLANNQVEYRCRSDSDKRDLGLAEVADFIQERL